MQVRYHRDMLMHVVLNLDACCNNDSHLKMSVTSHMSTGAKSSGHWIVEFAEQCRPVPGPIKDIWRC